MDFRNKWESLKTDKSDEKETALFLPHIVTGPLILLAALPDPKRAKKEAF